jgi:hypothetical protein
MLSRVVTFFALSLGTCAPQLLQEMKPELPLPPLDLPRLFLFFVILIPRKAPLGLLKRLGRPTTTALRSKGDGGGRSGLGDRPPRSAWGDGSTVKSLRSKSLAFWTFG